ncbi:MAG: DUF2339 domain-containing protein, partial [Candidatus Muiribacteriaceae bacterium]
IYQKKKMALSLSLISMIASFILITTWLLADFSTYIYIMTLFFINLNAFIFMGMSFVNCYYHKQDFLLPTITMIITSIVSFAMNFHILKEAGYTTESCGFAALIFAIVFSVVSFLFNQKHSGVFLIMFSSIAMIYGVIALSLLMSTDIYTSLLLLIGINLLYQSKKSENDFMESFAHFLFISAFIKFFFYDLSNIFGYKLHDFMFRLGFLNNILPRVILEIILAGSLFMCAEIYRRHGEKKWDAFFKLTGIISILVIFNIELPAIILEYFQSGIKAFISLAMVSYSFLFIYIGLRIDNRILRSIAFFLLFFTFIKILLYDIGNLEILVKMITFFIMGVLLLISSFLYYKYSGKYIGEDNKEYNFGVGG